MFITYTLLKSVIYHQCFHSTCTCGLLELVVILRKAINKKEISNSIWLSLKIFPDKWLFWKLKLWISDYLYVDCKEKSTWMIYLLYNFIKFHMYILVHPNQENIYLKSVLKSINNCADYFKSKCIVHFWNVKLYTILFLLSFWSRKCVSW